MIRKLEHSDKNVARDIYSVFQHSYKVEAQLLGVANFPPLARTADAIETAESFFYGYMEGDCLAAVIEISLTGQTLDIDSLTVDPAYFRKGIARKLLSYILTHFSFSQALVETAVENTPAIDLYQKQGFVEYKRWTPSHGIPKIALSLPPTDS
ncbi:GNAT family N-acetyltransferase [Bowmanella sp. Y26]|uniref:GNAT family N-acetyltransferase n=1 Tax=Bowmanella yangjiangensis TaxID=2811230 RepID=UPI001BDCAF03|nr:N-acetyltransferase [Bowmanella yangjiangensis]MBT1063030.1 GNAT family N-acetyltransferase [Bowmanella yangjiangensis]